MYFNSVGIDLILKKDHDRSVSFLSHFNGAVWNTCAERLMENRTQYQSISSIQFDELITIEHTKCKPLSVGMVVAKKAV